MLVSSNGHIRRFRTQVRYRSLQTPNKASCLKPHTPQAFKHNRFKREKNGQSRFSIGPGNWSGENFVGSSKKTNYLFASKEKRKKDKISSSIKCSASFYDSPTVLITCTAVLAVPHIDAIILFSLS